MAGNDFISNGPAENSSNSQFLFFDLGNEFMVLLLGIEKLIKLPDTFDCQISKARLAGIVSAYRSFAVAISVS